MLFPSLVPDFRQRTFSKNKAGVWKAAAPLMNCLTHMGVCGQNAIILWFENTVGILVNQLYSGANHRLNGKES